LLHAGLQHILPQRLMYCGPMFRCENPQRGRTRQFKQFGVESFGTATHADADLIAIAYGALLQLGIAHHVKVCAMI